MSREVYDLYKRTYKCDERESIRFAPMISKIYLDSVKKQRDQYKSERDTLIDDLAWYKAKVERLEHENKRLKRLTHKLTTHRTMWDQLKDWRRDMLEVDKNDTQLIGLGLVMDELEHNWLYKERD
ncbi:hypothetical protein ACU44U_08485 [Staphylococcus arlettae]